MKARGIKLSPEDMAKKQLELFDRKESIYSKIDKLKEEIEVLKVPAKEEPVKAHDHEVEPTNDRLLLAVEKALDVLEAEDR